jgi:hypothetical protein
MHKSVSSYTVYVFFTFFTYNVHEASHVWYIVHDIHERPDELVITLDHLRGYFCVLLAQAVGLTY